VRAAILMLAMVACSHSAGSDAGASVYVNPDCPVYFSPGCPGISCDGGPCPCPPYNCEPLPKECSGNPTCDCVRCASNTCDCTGGGGADCYYDDAGDAAGTFTVSCVNP